MSLIINLPCDKSCEELHWSFPSLHVLAVWTSVVRSSVQPHWNNRFLVRAARYSHKLRNCWFEQSTLLSAYYLPKYFLNIWNGLFVINPSSAVVHFGLLLYKIIQLNFIACLWSLLRFYSEIIWFCFLSKQFCTSGIFRISLAFVWSYVHVHLRMWFTFHFPFIFAFLFTSFYKTSCICLFSCWCSYMLTV